MPEVTDLEAQRLASEFRPNRKPLFFALLANGVMAGLLLGVPYVRGHQLAEAGRQDFARFARCLLGGEIASAPGLSLPRGERDHFAAKVMFASRAWPELCRSQLQRLAPEEAIFLWPSLKTAGADLRAAVGLVEKELTQLSERRKHGQARIPERPLEAVKRLQAAMVLYARAGGVDHDLDNDAIRFEKAAAGLVSPARLPLMAGETSTLEVWSSGPTLEALALDGRGLSYLRVADGKTDRERLRRTSFVRGVLRADDRPYIVLAMPDARCKDQEDHCAGRSTGLALYDKGATALPEPSWKLAGHPAGRVDRTLQLSQTGRIELIARTSAEGALELLRFRLPESAAGAPAMTKPQLLLASERFALRDHGEAASSTLLAGEPSGALYAQDAEGQVEASLTWAAAEQAPVQLPAAAGQGAWAVGCALGEEHYVAYGSTTELQLLRVAPGQPAEALVKQAWSLSRPLDEDNPGNDRVRLVCAAGRAQLLFVNDDHALSQLSCDQQGCSPVGLIASGVNAFSALIEGDETLVAYSGILSEALVRVVRLDHAGTPRAQPIAPAACWEPLGGMCGTPLLVRDAQRVVLTARDGADLLALESTDHAHTFAPLSGLVMRGSFEPSTTSPLQQHRLRKGLD